MLEKADSSGPGRIAWAELTRKVSQPFGLIDDVCS
jgi:hypothetical protein